MTTAAKCKNIKNKKIDSDKANAIIENRSAMVIGYLFISLFYLIVGILLGALVINYIM